MSEIQKPDIDRDFLRQNYRSSFSEKWWHLKDGGERPIVRPSSVDGLNNLAIRLLAHGGPLQQSRMIRDKRRSLDRAVLYSYQGAFVKHTNDESQFRALINPDKLKQDYDDKILSVGFEAGFNAGDVFEWVGTDTYWLIYLQDLNEVAYFRGEIRRCSYEVAWLNDNGEVEKTYVALRGPVETRIDYIQKHGISVDNPNHSIHLLLPRTESTVNYFKRYAKFYLQDDPSGICWRVEACDWLSTPNILEVEAVEYYANETEDKNGVVGALKLEAIQPIATQESAIKGENFIKPKKEYTYTYTGAARNGTWEFDTNLPLKYIIDGKTIKLIWMANYSGQFTLKYATQERTIVVETLF